MSAAPIVQSIVVAPLMENVYLVADEATKDCIVIDPGAEADRILAEINRLGLHVTMVVSTHGHIDHIGAVAPVVKATKALYAIHPADLPLVKNASSDFGGKAMFPDFEAPPKPDRQLADGDIIKAGNVSLTVIETPGHTPGSVCFYMQGLVFSGDTLFRGSIGRYDLPGGNGESILKSILSRLVPLPDDTRVFPGHGPKTNIAHEKKYNPFLREGFLLP